MQSYHQTFLPESDDFIQNKTQCCAFPDTYTFKRLSDLASGHLQVCCSAELFQLIDPYGLWLNHNLHELLVGRHQGMDKGLDDLWSGESLRNLFGKVRASLAQVMSRVFSEVLLEPFAPSSQSGGHLWITDQCS